MQTGSGINECNDSWHKARLVLARFVLICIYILSEVPVVVMKCVCEVSEAICNLFFWFLRGAQSIPIIMLLKTWELISKIRVRFYLLSLMKV